MKPRKIKIVVYYNYHLQKILLVKKVLVARPLIKLLIRNSL